MTTHAQMKALATGLRAAVKQGRALLSCESVTEEQVNAYKELVDGVLEGAEMSLDDAAQAMASKAEEAAQGDAPTPAATDVDAQPGADGMNASQESDDSDNEEEEEEDKDDEKDEDDDSSEDSDKSDDLDDESEELDEKEPREELEEVVDQTDKIVEKVDSFIAHTEDSGLTIDGIQEMTDAVQTMESLKPIVDLQAIAFGSPVLRTRQAVRRLTALTLRNAGKALI